jgi:hypothetical protein
MENTTTQIPEKLFYKAAEVCQITDTQPYVLRFWESEFPQLASEKNRGGQRVYRRSDIDLVFRIKKLLYRPQGDRRRPRDRRRARALEIALETLRLRRRARRSAGAARTLGAAFAVR